jgi:hypothetical protein
MENFVRDENLRLYRKALAETTDEVKRRILLSLIAILEDSPQKESEGDGAD